VVVTVTGSGSSFPFPLYYGVLIHNIYVVCSALLRKYVAATEMTRGVISENMEDEDDDSMSVSE
jgi:hypothetical protein